MDGHPRNRSSNAKTILVDDVPVNAEVEHNSKMVATADRNHQWHTAISHRNLIQECPASKQTTIVVLPTATTVARTTAKDEFWEKGVCGKLNTSLYTIFPHTPSCTARQRTGDQTTRVVTVLRVPTHTVDNTCLNRTVLSHTAHTRGCNTLRTLCT